MTNKEEEELMPIWQNHERRITTLENTFTGFSHKVDDFDKKIEAMEVSSENRWKSIEKKLDRSNDEQKELLNTLISHHLETKKLSLSKFWQVMLNITGAGGLLIVMIYAIVQIIQIIGGN